MRLLFVADGRSPTALNWIRHFVNAGHEVHLASTFPCSPDLSLASLTVIPVAFSAAAGSVSRTRKGLVRSLIPVGLRTALRQWLGILTLQNAAQRLASLVNQIQPEIVHAMRIPYEGMLASRALGLGGPALLVSVWGNDFTLHACSNPWMAAATRRALAAAQALHTDCQRDQRLARDWGYPPDKLAIVLPGGGGIDLGMFYPAPVDRLNEPATVINPRGWRAYVRNDVFFQAAAQVHARRPDIRFVCPNMLGEAQAEAWVARFGLNEVVDLLPAQSRQQMADWFRRSVIAVSPSTHDGTPNTLLEAMACGSFPVAGDIESLREWIVPGDNGLLVDPNDPAALASAVLQALDQPELRAEARDKNTHLVAQRAEHRRVMEQAEEFYRRIISIHPV